MNEFLKLNYSQKKEIWLTNPDSLRILVGVLGVLLPLFLFVFLYIDTHYFHPLESISHYYYTRVSSIFVITVSLLAIFLILYKGEEPIDFYLSAVAGIFALCVVLFPTDNLSNTCCDPDKIYSVTVLKDQPFRVIFHFISAGIFLGCLAVMSFFLFTKSDKSPESRTEKKKLRNKIYRVCGVVMVLAIFVIASGYKGIIIPEDVYDGYHLTYWMEVVALEFFGFSWLVKAEVFFKDE